MQGRQVRLTMFRRFAVILSTLLIAFGVLLTSILRATSVSYAYEDYTLPYPGKVLPDNPFWSVKTLRDRLWFFLTTDPGKRAEIKLLFADKRLASSKLLFELNKPELGFDTLTKAEKYLEEAGDLEQKNREGGLDTTEFLSKLAKASLKHRLVLEEIILVYPQHAGGKIIKMKDSPYTIFKRTREILKSKGVSTPESPFVGD